MSWISRFEISVNLFLSWTKHVIISVSLCLNKDELVLMPNALVYTIAVIFLVFFFMQFQYFDSGLRHRNRSTITIVLV